MICAGNEMEIKDGRAMKELRFFVITDTHFFKNALGAYGKEYEEFMDYEQKCFAETEAINRAVFQYLAESDEADIVLIAGDLSFDGEKESHKSFSQLLRDFQQKSGKRVYVVTAGHDVNCRTHAYTDAGVYTPEGTDFSNLYDLYREFGYDSALVFDREHLSYVADLSEDVRLLVLCNDTADTPHGAYSDAFLQWIEAQAKQAQADGKMMVAMEHYPVLAGQPLFALIGDSRQENSEALIRTLADNGVQLMFTGHMHNQSINAVRTERGNLFYDVCTGSVIGHPSFIRLVRVQDKKTVEIRSIPTPAFAWDTKGLSCEAYMKAQFDRMIRTYLSSMENDTERFLGRLRIKSTPGTVHFFRFAGRKLANMTIGQVARLLFVKADASIRSDSFTEFSIRLVRSVFEGNQPFVEGTPYGDLLLRVFRRVRPFIKKIRGTQGETLDFYETMKHTVGNYGIDDYNAVLHFD